MRSLNKHIILTGKAFVFLLAAVQLWLLTGCEKKVYNDALPVVENYSVKMLGPDSVILSGHLINTGADPILYEGFCYGTHANPPITENQSFKQQADTFFNRHIAVYHDSEYYYRCFAANGYGYSLTKPYHFTIPPGHPETAPCQVADNSVVYQGMVYSTPGNIKSGGSYAVGGGTWGLVIDCRKNGGPYINLNFFKKPGNGIYISTNKSLANPSQVLIYIDSIAVDPNENVYVSANPDGTCTISYCAITVQHGPANMANITN
jgi:hypothetical protein